MTKIVSFLSKSVFRHHFSLAIAIILMGQLAFSQGKDGAKDSIGATKIICEFSLLSENELRASLISMINEVESSTVDVNKASLKQRLRTLPSEIVKETVHAANLYWYAREE